MKRFLKMWYTETGSLMALAKNQKAVTKNDFEEKGSVRVQNLEGTSII